MTLIVLFSCRASVEHTLPRIVLSRHLPVRWVKCGSRRGEGVEVQRVEVREGAVPEPLRHVSRRQCRNHRWRQVALKALSQGGCDA
eukprot:CAMPEP_0197597848 /NCGR_PEP_ID=MMETSP1326-20131121/28148_1 /TAXON_ID=1155430 /ORGANISM="Genus nov. species nov., Strain RCC2288" /LENGTH=85 /DNA_ID=CAMNT_0043164577 /DNA_START=123 /DNA_END=377 /DNA_ORIENTATION=+